jgi:GxxExxY protein
MNVDDLTRSIIGCAFKVHNTLGPGFLEESMRTLLESNWKSLGLKSSSRKSCPFGTKARSWEPIPQIYGFPTN